MNDISYKLDGNVDEEKAKATGHYNCRACMTDKVKGRCFAEIHSEDDMKRRHFLANQLNMDASDDPRAMHLAQKMQDDYDRWYRHRQSWEPARKIKKHAGHELGARIFTLTYSPKWFDDATAREKMITAIERLLKYYRNEIVDFRASGEVGKNGLSHIHGYYLLKRGLKMTDKNFKRAWDHWNPNKKMNNSGTSFEGGHHDLCKQESDYAGYITKEKDLWYEYNHINADPSPPSDAS